MHTSQQRVRLSVALWLLLNVWLLQCETAAPKANVTLRIVGGHVTNIRAVPYLINLRRSGKFICGGALITRRHVLTAAHCVSGARPAQLRIVAGATTLTQNGYQSRVRKIFLPRGWNRRTINNDVAVLQLRRTLNGRNVRPIALCQRNPRPGNRVTVSGWGKTSQRSPRLSHRVRSVKVPIISRRSCQSQYRRRVRLTRSMMCAGVPGRKDSCTADSGGPLVSGGRVCGIVSFGVGCARTNSPGVYTNVMRVRRFILASIRKR